MSSSQDTPVFEHPLGAWIDPLNGSQIDEVKLMHEMAERQVVLLGETHTIAEIHRWQLHVATIIRFIRRNVAVGFEMFPRRVQPALDEWVAGELSTEQFLDKVDWKNVWGYDPQLYLPLFHFCRQQRVPMLALNCNRPLVTRVGKDGWDAVPEEERDGLSPAAEATVAYREYLFGLGLNRSPTAPVSAMDPKLDRFIRAQQTWDRAFACNIARALKQPDPPLVIGIIGRGHLEYGHGTPFQLRDLGIASVAVLLPARGSLNGAIPMNGIADAMFTITEPDPASAP
ncbi:MAG: hypothetical protein C0480_00880 [Bradyrhizobium sp.]|jgi:uncharacterized iron-regulated protein|nr:hypothetical protein [Bradyrhizobium sp.]